jgi:hypothetical protein
MAQYNGTYRSDLGRDYFGVTISTRFLAGDGVEIEPDESGLLPQGWRAAMADGRGPCKLSITPRRARLYLSDILTFELPIPFRGGSSEYQQFLAELGQLQDVRAWDILPERIAPYYVNLELD